MQESAEYKNVKLRVMTRKQLSYWLVDAAMKSGAVLAQLAFESDGSFFGSTEDRNWIRFLCQSADVDQSESLLNLIRSELEVNVAYSEAQIDQLTKSFSETYVDPLDTVSYFKSYVDDCSSRYSASTRQFLAPYVALVQASGSGKSRLLREVAKSVCTLYVCCRKGRSGYPPRTAAAYSFLFDGLSGIADYEARMNKLVARLRRADLAARLYLSQADELPGYDSSKADFPSEQLSSLIWNESEMIDPVKPNELVLLVIDEARFLLNEKSFDSDTFCFLRRALKRYRATHKDSRLFAVFVDTSAMIGNIVPSLEMDGSARAVRDEGGSELYHPFVLTDTFDAIFHVHKLPQGTRDLTPLLQDTTNYLLAGRPLVAKPPIEFHDDRGRDFLVRKLYGSASPAEGSKGGLGYLSIALMRLATSISSQSPAAADLVAGYMVYLLTTDLKREEMCVSHLAEPRLAQAAASEWSNTETLTGKLIPTLRSALISGKLKTGRKSEIVAQIVILLAFDSACTLAKKAPGSVVSLVSVLQQLLPDDSDIDVLDAIPDSLHNSSVSCGQFVQLAHDFDLDTHVRLAERHCGAAFNVWQGAVDCIVPLITRFTGVLLFQFKTCADLDGPGNRTFTSVEEMMPHNAFAYGKIERSDLYELDKNCVRVYLQLGSKIRSAFCGHRPGEKNQGPKALQIFGLAARCLSANVQQSLQSLIDSTDDLESKVLEQHALLEGKRPFPQDVERLSKSLPFVIDLYPCWSDFTKDDLLLACRLVGLSGLSKARKEKLASALGEKWPEGYEKFRMLLPTATVLKRGTVEELIDRCNNLSIKNVSKLNKSDLIVQILLTQQPNIFS
jgi:hypothetical protein